MRSGTILTMPRSIYTGPPATIADMGRIGVSAFERRSRRTRKDRRLVQAPPLTSIEAVRASYRPQPIITLFIGEFAPSSGAFFYFGNTALTRYMAEAMTAAGLYDNNSNFLDRFKSFGWFLDDLVLTPVNQLPRSERKKKCFQAQASLADRIAEYQPRAIVSLMLGIKHIVDAAAVAAGCNAPHFAVPFPGNGQQTRFRAAMVHILPQLPRAHLACEHTGE